MRGKAMSGAPIIIFFAFRTAKNRYRFTMTEAMYLKSVSRKDRNAVIRKSAQAYAQVLEETLRQHPLQWYHFKPFFEPLKNMENTN